MEEKFAYRIFRTGSDTLLAIADAALIGKQLRNGDFDVAVSKEFYQEAFCDEKEALELVREATIINAIGKNVIRSLQKHGFVGKNSILMISGEPHAQVVVVKPV